MATTKRSRPPTLPFSLRLTPKEKAAVKRAAEQAEKPAARWARERLVELAQRGASPPLDLSHLREFPEPQHEDPK